MRMLPAVLPAVLLATAMPARAAIVKHEFTATVLSIVERYGDGQDGGFTDSSSIAGPTISRWDTWTGAIFYDTDMALAPWQPPPSPVGSTAVYEGYIAAQIVDADTGLQFASHPTASTPAYMYVRDMPGGTPGEFVSLHANAAGTAFESASFLFSASYGTTLYGTALPGRLDLAQFPYSEVTYDFRGANGDFVSVSATITSLTPPPIPEPSMPAMLCAGLAALAMTARRRRA